MAKNFLKMQYPRMKFALNLTKQKINYTTIGCKIIPCYRSGSCHRFAQFLWNVLIYFLDVRPFVLYCRCTLFMYCTSVMNICTILQYCISTLYSCTWRFYCIVLYSTLLLYCTFQIYQVIKCNLYLKHNTYERRNSKKNIGWLLT